MSLTKTILIFTFRHRGISFTRSKRKLSSDQTKIPGPDKYSTNITKNIKGGRIGTSKRNQRSKGIFLYFIDLINRPLPRSRLV